MVDRAVAYQRNKSFTKEEIEAYWRSKKKAEGELRKATSSPTDGGQVSDTSDRLPVSFYLL